MAKNAPTELRSNNWMLRIGKQRLKRRFNRHCIGASNRMKPSERSISVLFLQGFPFCQFFFLEQSAFFF